MTESGTVGSLPLLVEPERRMSRAEWTEQREERRVFALSLPDPPTVFRSWAFADHSPLVTVASRALRLQEPAPSPASLSLALAPTPLGPELSATRRVHESSLTRLEPVPNDSAHRAAWRIAELDRLGREIEDRERRSWVREWPVDATRDADAAEVWAALFSGNPWGLRDRCEELWLATATRSFSGVLAARDLPSEVRSQVLSDLREAFFYRLLGDGHSTPGWAELAVRVLETIGPVIGPASTLSQQSRSLAGQCVTSRAGWARTTAALFATLPDREGRATAVAELFHDPATFEAVLDLHVALRFLQALPDDRRASWRLVTQNRGKARGRLRALVSADRYWLSALLAVDSLHARTQAAVARFAWSWAWQEMSRGFSFDAGRATTPPCRSLPPGLPPLTDDSASALPTWVLLVLLKGRWAHLERWVRTGGTGDRDSTWARLLKDLPDRVGDPDGGYKRVRIHLNRELVRYLEANQPVLQALSVLPIDRRLKNRVLARIEPSWHPEIALPRSGFPTFVENARRALALLEEDPCH